MDAAAALDAYLAATPAVPGAVVCAIDAEGGRHTATSGWADPVARRPMTADAAFRLASSTKTFTAAVVLRLVEEGVVALDDPLARFFDAATVERLGLHEITLRHLLQHTSGLPDMDGEEFMAVLYGQPDKRWTPWEKIERALVGRPRTGAVGPPARYSDVGYVVAAMAVEAATGGPLHAAFRRLLRFDQLELRAMHVESLEPTPPGAGARVRHFVGDRDVTDIDPSCDLWGAGGLVSDARDLAEWWHALFGGAVFDRPETLDLMLSTVPEPSADRDMGLGLYRRVLDGHEVWAHGGWWGSYPVHDRTTGTTAAILLTQCLDHAGPGLRDLVLAITG